MYKIAGVVVIGLLLLDKEVLEDDKEEEVQDSDSLVVVSCVFGVTVQLVVNSCVCRLL